MRRGNARGDLRAFRRGVRQKRRYARRVFPRNVRFDGFLSTELVSKRGADVVTMEDEYFRPLTNNLEPLGETASANVSKLYTGIESRLVYNVETGLSDANAKRYALPLYNNTVVTYVNVSKLKAAGVKCISVEDSDEAIAAFNAGGKDANGNTKADLGITATVLRKGFQRDNPYYGLRRPRAKR